MILLRMGEYADSLRALGRYLDEVTASEITIIEERADLGVVWTARGGMREARSFGAGQLRALRVSARLYRGLESTAPRFGNAEILRTLGDIVDESWACGVTITETATGFRLNAFSSGRELA